MAKKIVTDLDVAGKKVLVRVDFNVPMKDGVITDDNRIVQALPTIQYLIDNKAKLILFSHLGKVKTEEDKASKSLAPVAKRLGELLGKEVTFVPETRGAASKTLVSKMSTAKKNLKTTQNWANTGQAWVTSSSTMLSGPLTVPTHLTLGWLATWKLLLVS